MSLLPDGEAADTAPFLGFTDAFTSALYWYPRIESLPTPKTILIPFDWNDIIRALDGEAVDWHREELEAAGETLGYPVFLRTDLTSAKHSGPSVYRIESREEFAQKMWLTLEDNAMKDQAPSAWMVREWLDLDAPFAAFDEHPIANEWRFFASPTKIHCRHFYWPTAAMQFWNRFGGEPEGWREALRKMNSRNPPLRLYEWAKVAASVCQDFPTWSVDFAKDKSGKWWLIDMAQASSSWHPERCQNRFR